MGIRKNAKFLSAAERVDFVKACVLMKADIVNPGDPPASQYSKWDEYVAIHAKIQSATAPGPVSGINFGHGGVGAYGFLSWHRYFLYQFELQLQSYVPGVTLPYWDWTDPANPADPNRICIDTFIGPNGDVATSYIVNQGYFAYNKPGSAATPAAGGVPAMPANTTTLPAWWPPSLPGWRLPAMFPSTWVGGLKRKFRSTAALPHPSEVQEALGMPDYPSFQAAVEAGTGLTDPHTIMHNAIHGWVGDSAGHMTPPTVSNFDPLFYLHHCNVDRLWAMWQMDGHATEFPIMGGDAQHHRNDIMYPWIGATAGYSTQSTVAPTIPMPGGLPLKRNVDTLDFRALGYSYDCIPIIGLGLDRTGSMLGLTPDPMTGMGTVSKWDAATRGVSAFLQDCEAAKTSGLVYITAGVQTFRSLPANDFVNVFGAPGYGLIKTGSPSFSKAAFDGAIAGMTPAGGTPLADALNNVRTTLVQAPFGNLPANERRYMAFLTDGLLTSGAPLNSIPNGSFTNTAVFTMGFGTGADVDYITLAAMKDKGISLATPQVFHGETAGTIDKFYANALAAAIGFTPLVDPVVELFAGEHTHIDFFATSAEDSFLITAQGMDFQDNNWSFMLHSPTEEMLYGDATGMTHGSMMGCHHCCPSPHITARRANGRLTLIIQKGNTGDDCWVGKWQLMISYKAKGNDKMMMPDIGELVYPVGGGVIRGPRYARLLQDPKSRVAARNIFTPAQHGLDGRAPSTNAGNREACNMLINIYGRTQLKLNLQAVNDIVKRGEPLTINVTADINLGKIQYHRALVRFTAPAFDIAEILPPERVAEIIKQIEASKRYNRKLDIALILAQFEKEKDLQFINDREGKVVSHEGGPLHMHEKDTAIPGLYHFGFYIEGAYFPGAAAMPADHHDHTGAAKMEMYGAMGDQMATADGQLFTRILNISVAVV